MMLFDIVGNKEIETDLPIITGNYTNIIFDEFPMLFSGTNAFGNVIVGSLMCEDEDNDIIRYMHLLVTHLDYADFTRKKITYRQLVEKQKNAFFIDRDEDDKIVNTYYLPLGEVPKKYLPHAEFIVPNLTKVLGTEFRVSLKGKLADMHEAFAERVAIISKGINQFITNLAGAVNIGTISSETHMQAFTASSFGINYKVKFSSKDMFFNSSCESALNNFMASSMDYSLNYLSSEAKKLKDDTLEDSQFEKMVEIPLRRVYDSVSQKYDSKARGNAIDHLLKVPFEMEKITDQLGMGFDYLEINTGNEIGGRSTLGVVDQDFSDSLAVAKEIIEGEGPNIENDSDYLDYTIHVYHLNVESRKGNAHISNTNVEGKLTIDSPKISIEGEGPLNGSTFINSMDNGTFIKVQAKAKKVNGRFKNLTINSK